MLMWVNDMSLYSNIKEQPVTHAHCSESSTLTLGGNLYSVH